MDHDQFDKTWKQLEQRWEQGFEQLSLAEQQAIALWWLEAETMNGTLNQFFWNSSGDLALIARDGLVRLQQPITLKALDSALAYFGALLGQKLTKTNLAQGLGN